VPHDPRSLRRAFARWSEEQKTARTPFAPVYKPHADQLLTHRSLSRTAKLVYLWLLIHNSRKTGEERWTIAQIAEGIALKERAVQTALAELEEHGWIFRYQFGANKAYNYFIVPPDRIGTDGQAEPTRAEEETADDH
jgi:DNA-binding MarR family transcriptional regulator